MWTVEILINTSIRGPRRGTGRVMYILKTYLKNGKEHVSVPVIAEYEDTTENQLVLYAVKDALLRMNCTCQIVVRTQSTYIESVFSLNWPQEWKIKDWKTARGEDVKDCALWKEIVEKIGQFGHEVMVENSKHEYTEWMAWNLEIVEAKKGYFSKVPKA